MRADARGLSGVVAGAACAAVALQIAYPLTHGSTRDAVTIAVVLTFAAASAAHAVRTLGWLRGGALVLVIMAGGFAVEVLGVHTGVPFGSYAYADSLGPRLFTVPLLLGAAWTMLAWPAAVVARRLAASYLGRVGIGAWALASWDLFLDPQMVADGHWTWSSTAPHLPGVDTVPLTNYAGWLLVSLVVSLLLQAFVPRPIEDDAVPVALYLWTWIGSVVAFLVFLDGLAAAAGWGALGMGLVAVPLVAQLIRSSR